MRKIFILTFTILCFSVFADESPIFNDIPGSYAIYHDQRFDDDVFIGICFIGDNTILARSYETNTKNELILLIPFVRTTNGIDMAMKLKIVKGSMTASNASNRLLPMILNWANTWVQVTNKLIDETNYFISTDDDYYYLSWIPVFQLETIGNDDKFSVITIGKLKNNTDTRFFGFTQLPKPIDSESYIIDKADAIDVIIDGLKVPLDNNWHTDDSKIYRITKRTSQDAIFMIETFNYKQAGFSSVKQLAQVLLISNSEAVLLTEGTEIFLNDNTYNIKMRMYNPNQQVMTIQQSQFIERDIEIITMATLSCYETLYLKNKEFFDSIIY